MILMEMGQDVVEKIDRSELELKEDNTFRDLNVIWLV